MPAMPPHPLIPCALAALAGIALAGFWPAAWPVAFAAAFAAAFALLAALIWQGGRAGRFSPPVLALFFFLLAAGRAGCLLSAPAPELARLADGSMRRITGLVASAAEPTRWGHRVLMELEGPGRKPVPGLVRLDFPKGVSPPGPGQRISLDAKLKPFVNFANPGGFDYSGFMAKKGILARAYAGKKAGLSQLGPGGLSAWKKIPALMRQRAGDLFQGLPEGAPKELLRALALGRRAALLPKARSDFAAAGVAHLLAISGLHLGLVWGAGYLALRLVLAAWPALALRFAVPKLAAFGAFIPCLAYAVLASGGAPTLRALVMAACLVGALFLDRPYRPAGALAFAALILGLAWPGQIGGASFQLSFIAVGAILLAGVPLAERLPKAGRGGRLLWGVSAWLLVSLVVGLSVWPLSALYFHQISFIFLPANALLVPLTGFLVLPLALIGCFTGLAWPAFGQAVLGLALYPAAWSIDLASALAGIKWSHIFLAGPGPWATALIYAGLFFAACFSGKRRVMAAALACLMAAGAWWLEAPHPKPDGRLFARVLDVGQGQAVVLTLPDGKVLVVDAGGLSGGSLDTGRQVVAPFLWSLGIGRVFALAASHADFDHTGGLPFLARWFSPRQIWTNGLAGKPCGSYTALLAEAESGQARLLGPGELFSLKELGGARVSLLWPLPGGAPKGWKSNDASLWLGFALGDCAIWLPGDAGPKVERRVAPLLPRAGKQIILAPHHGAKHSLSPALLQRLKPEAVVISAGWQNRFGFPRRSTMERIRAHGAAIWQTALYGCISLSTGGRSWRITPYLQKPRVLPAGGR